MKICLVQPPSPLLLEDKVMPPLGILYLAAWLRKHGHEVSIIDLAGITDFLDVMQFFRNSLNEIKIMRADVVGFTCTTPQYNIARRITEFLKTRGFDKQKYIVGGIHTTSLVHAGEMDFLKRDGFDSYCVGEGYNAVTKIGGDLEETGQIKPLYTEPILRDVNELPFAARDLIDIHSYKYKLGDTLTTTMYTQYGCPYSCQYCESPMAGSFTVRAQNPEHIIKEVQHIRNEFGIHGMMFFDDEMNLDIKRMSKICDGFKELGDCIWRGFVVTAKWNMDVARKCKDSGCFEIASGIESGSPTILRNIKKPATIDINRRFVETSKKAGLRVKGFFIIGLAGESWQTVKETDQWIDNLRKDGYAFDDCDFSILQIYPGSPFYSNPQDIVFQDVDPDKSYYKSAPGSYEDLVQVQTAGMTKYDLICARNYMEYKHKQKGWIKEYSDRKDLDKVYETGDVADTIRYAERKLRE